MPYQNRVTPFGEIIAVAARGTWTGNRGIIHRADGTLGMKRWATQAWIACLLDYQGRTRVVMAPGAWTNLFFLDETTALAAGHRPCFFCRRTDALRFKAAWLAGNPDAGLRADAPISALDAVLHRERVTRSRLKVTYRAPLATLPAGTFVTVDAAPDVALLVDSVGLRPWTPTGYGEPVAHTAAMAVTVLTPRSIVNAISAGYTPCAGYDAPLHDERDAARTVQSAHSTNRASR